MIFESYGVGKYSDSHIDSTSYLLRANAYRVPHEKEPNLGIIPHTDTSFVSVVKQDSVQGLQVQLKDGTWIPVHLPQSSFAVIAGDAMLVSNFLTLSVCFQYHLKTLVSKALLFTHYFRSHIIPEGFKVAILTPILSKVAYGWNASFVTPIEPDTFQNCM